MQSPEAGEIPADWNSLWRGVSESLLSGLHHALNNRVAALSAIAQVLGSDIRDASPLVASLTGEVARLEETVSLISLLRRARSHAPEPVQAPELVAGLATLLAQHNDLKEIVFLCEADPGVLPVLVERDLLTRVMLALMTSVGLQAERSGQRQVRVSYAGDEAEVAISVECVAEPIAAESAGATIRRLDARAAGEAVRMMNGTMRTLRGTAGELGYEVRLPTLLAGRRNAGSQRL